MREDSSVSQNLDQVHRICLLLDYNLPLTIANRVRLVSAKDAMQPMYDYTKLNAALSINFYLYLHLSTALIVKLFALNQIKKT